MSLNLGLVAAFLGGVMGGMAITAEKKLGFHYKNKQTVLVLKYISVTIFSLISLLMTSILGGTEILPAISLQAWLVIVGVGIIGYISTFLVFKSFEHLSSAIIVIISKLSIFLLYFINLYLFDGPEHLPLFQMILAIVFFLIIVQFVLDRSDDNTAKKYRLNIYALLPMAVAVCSALFTAGNTWLVKTHTLTPIQTMFMTEGMIFVVAIVAYLLTNGWNMKEIKNNYRSDDLIPLAITGFGIVWAVTLFYYAYLDNPANIINFMTLLLIFWTAIFSGIFLGDKLTKKQIGLMLVAFLILIAFVFADDILQLL